MPRDATNLYGVLFYYQLIVNIFLKKIKGLVRLKMQVCKDSGYFCQP